MQHTFIRLCDRLECYLSQWWGASLYCASMVGAHLLWGWDAIDRWVYITNALLVVLLVGNARRSDKAMHIKLDEIDPEPHEGLEQRDEREMGR